jgi:DNA-directed RNA polymerase sigma subunit (sigma70/sigma32)
MNYLRDHSRLVRIPRSYVELYLKIRKVQRKHPGYHELEIADALGVPVSKVQASLEAFSMRFSSAAEMCHSKFEQFEQLGDSEDLREIFGDKYKELLVDIANLPETDEQFLVDYLVKKRSAKTLMKNYPHINSAEDIKSYSNTLINNLLNPHK